MAYDQPTRDGDLRVGEAAGAAAALWLGVDGAVDWSVRISARRTPLPKSGARSPSAHRS
ncbi:hypothetical protein [Streptomyces sp. NPDC059010]|uniref:hypothetical protein n=1 Tax=Streptomyces sp. NPDC059010 TaxID=3346695 RepID=UPI0036BE9343